MRESKQNSNVKTKKKSIEYNYTEDEKKAINHIKKITKGKKPRTTLTIKQRKFVDEVVKTGNATEATIKAGYKYKNRHVAESVGSENMRKPEIKASIEDRLQVAKNMIYTIATTAEKDDTKLRACQDIIDRAEGKATQKVEGKIDGDLVIKIVNFGEEEKKSNKN